MGGRFEPYGWLLCGRLFGGRSGCRLFYVAFFGVRLHDSEVSEAQLPGKKSACRKFQDSNSLLTSCSLASFDEVFRALVPVAFKTWDDFKMGQKKNMSEFDEASKVITSARKCLHQIICRPSSAQDFGLYVPGRYFAAKNWSRIKSSVLSSSFIIQSRTFGYCKPCYFWR